MFSGGQLTHFIDGSFDPQNWLNAVNCARYKKEENLTVLQDSNEIYYEAVREIAAGEELLVWYGIGYERFMEIPIRYIECIAEEDTDDSKSKCNFYQQSQRTLQLKQRTVTRIILFHILITI